MPWLSLLPALRKRIGSVTANASGPVWLDTPLARLNVAIQCNGSIDALHGQANWSGDVWGCRARA